MSQQIEGSSLKETSCVSMDSPVKRDIRKKKSSKKHDSDADSMRENKNSSQEILSEECVSSSTISMVSSPKTRTRKQKISVGAKAKKRSLKLEEQDKKEPEKPKKYSRRTANTTLSESPTKADASERNFKTKKASNKIMLTWLRPRSENKPSTYKITSPKRDLKNKSSEEFTLSLAPKKGIIESKHDKKRRSRPRTKKISRETVPSQIEFSAIEESGLKTSQNNIMLSPSKTTASTSKVISSKKVLKSSEIINSLTPKKIVHLKSKEHVKKIEQKLKKVKKNSQETAKTKENLLKRLGSTSKNKSTMRKSSESIDSHNVKPATKSRKNKKIRPTKRSKTMSFKTLANLSPNTIRNITMQDIFGPDDLPTSQTNLAEPFESAVVIPTVKEILAERKELLIYKALVDQAKIIRLPPNPFINVPKEPVKPPMKLLDCKHLSLEEIKQQFIKNKTVLGNIQKGIQYSEKHEQFHRFNSRVPYNPSNLVFTYPQINCMANLIREEIDREEKQLRYTFSVLIPELCLLIFMDKHKMTKEETVKYLDECPID